MTFIAEGGTRTVTNCTVYDRRKVYEITTSVVLDVVQSQYGTGEVERTGQTVVEDRIYHVIADSEEMARALYQARWGSPLQRHMLLGVKVLFVIDAEIKRENN